MKKIMINIMLLIALMSIMTGCADRYDLPYEINNSLTITSVQVKDMEKNEREGIYKIIFTKDNKNYKYDIEKWLYDDIDKNLSTAKILNRDKWVYFDIVIDGEELVSVTFSNNKK